MKAFANLMPVFPLVVARSESDLQVEIGSTTCQKTMEANMGRNSLLISSCFTFLSCLLLVLTSNSFACDGGRIPCSHKCEQSQRARGCKDSRNASNSSKPYCVTAAFCRDANSNSDACTDGWIPRETKCTKAERANGCHDKRAPNGQLCIKYY